MSSKAPGTPSTVGLCPDPRCTQEFYMPDAKPSSAEPSQWTRQRSARIRHSADVIDADEVSRTARTLNRIALVIEVEFAHFNPEAE